MPQVDTVSLTEEVSKKEKELELPAFRQGSFFLL